MITNDNHNWGSGISGTLPPPKLLPGSFLAQVSASVFRRKFRCDFVPHFGSQATFKIIKKSLKSNTEKHTHFDLAFDYMFHEFRHYLLIISDCFLRAHVSVCPHAKLQNIPQIAMYSQGFQTDTTYKERILYRKVCQTGNVEKYKGCRPPLQQIKLKGNRFPYTKTKVVKAITSTQRTK